MYFWLTALIILFIVVIIVTKRTNSSLRNRKTHNFKTNYFAKKKAEKTNDE